MNPLFFLPKRRRSLALGSAALALLQLASVSAWAEVNTALITNKNVTAPVSPAPIILPMTRKADALSVMPDRANWTYALGEKASFQIRFNVSPYPAEGIAIKYRIGPEMREGNTVDAMVPAAGLTLAAPTPTEPGFIRCIVTATIDGKALRQLATVGFSPDKLVTTQTEPADFDRFWAAQKAYLNAIPPDYQLTAAPELSTPKAEVFYLSFQNVSNHSGPSRFYGVLAVPRGAGPFPALLNVPGAGVRAYTGNITLAERGVITLQVGIHGIPVNLPKELYDQLGTGALFSYNAFNLDDHKRYYYRRVYMGALRASEYLTTHPKWDGKNLVLMGGSQGGQLSIVTTALNPRVTAVAANYPAYSDVSGYYRGRTGGWPGFFRPGADGKFSDEALEAKLRTTSYYDTVNFARRIKVPGTYFFGYNDEITPPSSTYTAYNTITAPKQLMLALDQGHYTNNEQQGLIDNWVLQQVADKK